MLHILHYLSFIFEESTYSFPKHVVPHDKPLVARILPLAHNVHFDKT